MNQNDEIYIDKCIFDLKMFIEFYIVKILATNSR